MEINPAISVLEELGYTPISTKDEEIISFAIDRCLTQYLGKAGAKILLESLCHNQNVSSSELLTDYTMFENAVRNYSGSLADIVRWEAGKAIWDYFCAKYPTISTKNKQYLAVIEKESSNSTNNHYGLEYAVEDRITPTDNLKKMHMIEAFEFVRQLPAKEHVVLLYNHPISLNEILAEFFDPETTADMTNGLFSSESVHFVHVETFLYQSLLGLKKQTAIKKISDWLSQLQSKPTSSIRIAGQDTWFIENGFEDEILSLEKTLGKSVQGPKSFLCTYKISKLSEQQLRGIVGSHGYVILDDPFTVYKASC